MRTFLSLDALSCDVQKLGISEAPLPLWIDRADGEGAFKQVKILEICLAVA
jgi:hypothetical protein